MNKNTYYIQRMHLLIDTLQDIIEEGAPVTPEHMLFRVVNQPLETNLEHQTMVDENAAWLRSINNNYASSYSTPYPVSDKMCLEHYRACEEWEDNKLSYKNELCKTLQHNIQAALRQHIKSTQIKLSSKNQYPEPLAIKIPTA